MSAHTSRKHAKHPHHDGHVEAATSIDHGEAAAAYERNRARFAAIATDAVKIPYVDCVAASASALRLVATATSPAIAPRLASLPPSEFSPDVVGHLRDDALALFHTHDLAEAVRAKRTHARVVDAALVTEETALRRRLLAIAEYHLGDDPTVAPELATIRHGHGYNADVRALGALARIFDEHAALLRRDLKYVEGDEAHARRLAVAIAAALDPEDDAGKAVVLDEHRVFTALDRDYGEVQKTLAWLLRHESGNVPTLLQACNPNLSAAVRAALREKKKATGEPHAPPPA